MADLLNRINTGLLPGTKKGAFHPIYSGSFGYGSGWRRCGSGWRRLSGKLKCICQNKER